MSVRIGRFAAIALVINFASTSIAPASARVVESSFFFPRLVLIRGGELREPVSLRHGPRFSESPIVIAYSSLTPISTIDPLTLASESRYEVAEFFGPPTPAELLFTRTPDSTTPLFAGANHYSKLYPATARHPAIWENPLVRPGGMRGRYFALSDSATRVLTRLGVPLR